MGEDQEFWRGLCALGKERSFSQGEHLLRWDDHADTAGVLGIRDGVCKVVNSTRDGRESLVAVRGPGEIVGELGALTGAVRSASVVALTPVRAAVVGIHVFDRWLDTDPGAGRQLAAMLAARILETTRPGATAHQRVEARLADRVLFLRERFGTGERIDAPLTHEDLAAWIGATRAVTTRALGSLRNRGCLEFGRGWIEILDADALQSVAYDG